MSRIELVVGLGNPGAEYAASRHNAGFRVVDELARRRGVVAWERRCSGDVARAGGSPALWLARPRTFMNRSGEAVECLLAELELEPASLLVVVDDVDLPLGATRLRRGGGPGTHNGMRDVCRRIGTGFPRLRIGVRGDDVWDDLADYVLSPFAAAEAEVVAEMVGRSADAVETAVADDLSAAMERFNRKPSRPDPD